MQPLTRADLWSLEDYAEQRPAFRARVLAHKRDRRVSLGEHLVLLFEDRLTIHYQVQEMLRIERIFEKAAIQEELDAYNPLIPGGANWKATAQIEYADLVERTRMLERLRGVEERIWVEVAGQPRVFAIADEDLARSNERKTAAVHFLRFPLEPPMIRALRAGAALRLGVDHPEYREETLVGEAQRTALLADLD